MLLTSDAGVREKFLHVEQSARHTVDRVLAFASAEERAGDGDLGELDRQVSGGVVNGERHLGATEGRALRGAGEDDVVHLLAAHRRRGLGTEHPGNGVNDVALARPVRTDHHGDARLEFEGGRVSERLEALQRQRLEKHLRKQ